jgi:elongation factor G
MNSLSGETENFNQLFIMDGKDNNKNFQILKCIAPEAELYGFSTEYRSMTKGRATFNSAFSSYQPVPENVQKNLVRVGEGR